MIVFHHNDADGRCAARWVLEAKLERDKRGGPGELITFIEMDYAKQVPFDMVMENEEVYIVDFSFEPEDMRKLLSITKNVIWIDHHKTAIEKYQGFEYDIPGLRYNSIAGCMLTYCYLFHMTEYGVGKVAADFQPSMTEFAPRFTKLIADWDVWSFEYGDETRQFVTALNAEDTRPESDFWYYLMTDSKSNCNYRLALLIDDGKKMLRFRDGFAKNYIPLGFHTMFEGYRCFAMNIGHINSEWFKEVTKGNPYDILIAFVFNGKKFQVSLYSETVNVSEIAKKYGGGGHLKASGFVCECLPFSAI